VSIEEFIDLYEHISEAAIIAREALEAESLKEAVNYWRSLFGDEFPPSNNGNGGKTTDPKGPFGTAKSRTGDLTPRKYGSSSK